MMMMSFCLAVEVFRQLLEAAIGQFLQREG